MNSFISQEEINKKVRKVALENMIANCDDGIKALKRFRLELTKKLESLK